MPDELDKLNFSARLLAQEALRRGYQLNPLSQTSSNFHSPIVECVREGKKVYFHGTATNLDSPIAHIAALDKITTNEILANINLPIPETLVLSRNDISTNNHDHQGLSDILSQDLLVAVCEFLQKHPVLVIKPSNTDHGKGVTVGVSGEPDLIRAIIYACKESERADILIQEMVHGQEFRFLVVNGRTVYVAHRMPPSVIGDGKRTLRELVEIENTDPRRGNKYESPLTKISLDDVCYSLGAKELDRIPLAGEKVELLKTSNLSRGGDSINMTELASQSLKDLAAKAAKACGLGIAGVDIVTEDIPGDTGKILEVNVSPGLRVTVGEIDIAKIIFDELEKI